MKKYGIIAALVAVVVAGVVGWRFFYGRDDSMASSLPADVTMVGRIDAKALVVDNGLGTDDLKRISPYIEKSGIDFQTMAYVFASQGYLGAIVPLSDADDFEAMLTQEGNAVEEQRGLKWSVVEGNILLAFDNDRAMLMGPAVGSEQDALRNTLATCMNQKASDSGKQSRLYKIMEERREPVAMAANLSALPASLLNDYTKYINLPLEALDLTAGLTAKGERMELAFGLQSEDKEVGKQMAKLENVLEEIDGDLSKTLPTTAVCHLLLGIDGEDLLEQLRANRLTRTIMLAANMVLDLDMIVKNIDGDVALSMFQDANDADTQHLLFQAKVDDDEFMRNVDNWNDATARSMGFSFYTQGRDAAVCMYSGKPIYFGTRDKRLYITDFEAMTKVGGQEDVKRKMTEEMKGCLAYATWDLRRINSSGQEFRSLPPQAEKWIEGLDRIVFSVRSFQDIKLDIIAPQGTNILKEIVNE